jgi:hypothetical protein
MRGLMGATMAETGDSKKAKNLLAGAFLLQK